MAASAAPFSLFPFTPDCTRVTCRVCLASPFLDRCADGTSSGAAPLGLGNGTAKRRVWRPCSSRAEHDVQATTAGLRASEAVSLPATFHHCSYKSGTCRARRLESLSRKLKYRILSLTSRRRVAAVSCRCRLVHGWSLLMTIIGGTRSSY